MARFKDLPEEIILSILEYTWEAWREEVENHAHLESYMGSPHLSFQSNLLPVSSMYFLPHPFSPSFKLDSLSLSNSACRWDPF